jgi:hypothetical protein
MEPINYMLDIQSPLQQALTGYGLGRQDIEQRQIMDERAQMMDLRAAQEARSVAAAEEQRAAAAQARAKSDAMQAQLVGLREQALNGTLTVDALNQFSLANAETFADFTTAFQQMEADKSRPQVQFAIETAIPALSGNPDRALAIIDERIAAAENAGEMQEAQALRADRAILEADPQAYGVSSLSMLVATGAIDDKQAETILKLSGQGQPGTADVQSTDYIGGIAVVTTLKDGTVQIKDARSNKIVTGDAAKELLKEAQEGEAEMAGGKAGAAERAKLEEQIALGTLASAANAGGKASIDFAKAASDAVAAVRSNIGTLDRAIELAEDGADTGVIARNLPSWNASTIELNNLQGQLTIDVIGAVTFGALSEGELALAMDIALPTGLDEKELADWLRRKRTAQQKLANYHSKRSRFFSDGFSVGQWEEFIESGETDMRAWMDKNVPGPRRRTTAPAPTTAAPTGGRLKFDENGDPIP